MIIIIGILLGIPAGIMNYFIFDKEMKEFLTTKRWPLTISWHALRCLLMIVVFYFAMKKSLWLLAGVLTGFFLTQVICFAKKARNSSITS